MSNVDTLKQNAKRRRAPKMESAERREHLLKVAIEQFAEKGIDSARHSSIATAAGVAVPTVHAYFNSRDDLVLAVLGRVHRRIIDDFLMPFTTQQTFEDRMLLSGAKWIEGVAEEPDLFKVWLMWSSHFGEPFKSLHQEFVDEALNHLPALLAPAGPESRSEIAREDGLMMLGLAAYLAQMALRGESVERQVAFVRNVTASFASLVSGRQ